MKKLTEIVKKWLKKYFLYVANAPIWKGILTGMLLFVVLLLGIILFFGTGWKALNLGCIALTISSYVTLGLVTINYIVAKLFTTSFTNSDKRVIVIYNEGVPEKYKKPLWGQIPYCTISLPEYWKHPLTKRIQSIGVDIKIRVNKQIAMLKFQAFFSFTDELTEGELNTLIKSQANYQITKHVDFSDCIKSLFESYNANTGNNDVVEIVISDWLDSDQLRSELINKINGIVNFPNKLFDNMQVEFILEKVGIQLACILD